MWLLVNVQKIQHKHHILDHNRQYVCGEGILSFVNLSSLFLLSGCRAELGLHVTQAEVVFLPKLCYSQHGSIFIKTSLGETSAGGGCNCFSISEGEFQASELKYLSATLEDLS